MSNFLILWGLTMRIYRLKVILMQTLLLISGVNRYGLSRSFLDAGYECVIGDLMFTVSRGDHNQHETSGEHQHWLFYTR